MAEEEQTQENTDAPSSETTATTIFYDGQCPLCSREIAHYRRLRGAEHLNWVDITRDHQMLDAHGLTYDAAMARFHVLDDSGHWQTGAWGFVELWANLPAYRWLARTLRTLRIVPLLDRLYSVFARRRARRSCDTGICTSPMTLERATSEPHCKDTRQAQISSRQDI